MEYSRPGKPTDNAWIESFNGTLREECLNVHCFDDLIAARRNLQAWQQEYNESRPHRSLIDFIGGADGDRTHDLLTASQALSQAELQPLRWNRAGGAGTLKRTGREERWAAASRAPTRGAE